MEPVFSLNIGRQKTVSRSPMHLVRWSLVESIGFYHGDPCGGGHQGSMSSAMGFHGDSHGNPAENTMMHRVSVYSP